MDRAEVEVAEGLVLGEALEVLRSLPDACLDAVVTDPPYGIRFMGEAWDGDEIEASAKREHERQRDLPPRLTGGHDAKTRKLVERSGSAYATPGGEAGSYDFSLSGNRAFQSWCEEWARECLRVLKPGGHLLSFGGTRTYHRLGCGVEDAGFEIRDSLIWLYGSGFPKSLNISKAIDKAAGAERPVVDVREYRSAFNSSGTHQAFAAETTEREVEFTEAATPEAKRWEGWGTALKPGQEPIVVGRKPFRGSVFGNVLEHGTGGMNIAATRLGENAGWSYPAGRGGKGWGGRESLATNLEEPMKATEGRWPANVILSHHEECELVGEKTVTGDGHFNATSGPSTFSRHGFDTPERERDLREEVVEDWACVEGCPVRMLDEQAGERASTGAPGRPARPGTATVGGYGGTVGLNTQGPLYSDQGGPSRFFYCAKASRAEKEAGLEDFEAARSRYRINDPDENTIQTRLHGSRDVKNVHPTVKPLAIMRWLLRLVVPPGGLVLDPFLGSGTTAIAAELEGFRWLGIEREEKYARIAEARLAFWREHGSEGLSIVAARESSERRREVVREAGQLDLFGAAHS